MAPFLAEQREEVNSDRDQLDSLFWIPVPDSGILRSMIALVDYGMGNLRSVEKALRKVGGEVRIATKGDHLADAAQVVLPGVGAFRDCMHNLKKQKLVEPLLQFLRTGKPFLGICLGYQLLFERSAEGGDVAGLGVLKGAVVRFPDPRLKVPQIGWNQIAIQKRKCPLLQGVEDGSHLYFVHSYFPEPQETAIVCASTDYGVRFASMIWTAAIFGCQFHPEKSQAIGLKILENFVRLGK